MTDRERGETGRETGTENPIAGRSLGDRILFPLFVIVSGILSGSFFGVGLTRFENNFVMEGLGELSVFAARAILGFFFGAWVVISVPWIFTLKVKHWHPFRVFLGVLAGAVAGMIATFFIHLWLIQLESDSSFLGDLKIWGTIYSALGWVFILVHLGAVFIGIRLASRRTSGVPQRRSKRWVVALAGAAILLLPLFLSVRGRDFPSGGTMSERHEWALDEFGEYYLYAIEYIEASPIIRADVGDEIVVAPDPRSQNVVSGSIDGASGHFTLEVKGHKGKGTCRLVCIKDFHDDDVIWMIIGRPPPQWEFQGEVVTLTVEDNFR
jgi:hypothetical protein